MEAFHMKKYLIFFSLLVVLLFVKSCEFQMPSSIEIRGTPEMRFSTSLDLSEHVKGLFADIEDSDDFEVFNCINTPIMTLIIYMELFNGELESLDTLNALLGSNTSVSVSNNVPLVNEDEPLILPAMNFDIFDGFELISADIKSKLYISGSEIANIISVNLNIDNNAKGPYKKNGASGLADNFPGFALPHHGSDIALDFRGEESEIKYSIFIEAGETVTADMLIDPSVKIELAIWVPLRFNVEPGAILDLPNDMFSEDEDLFGRNNLGDDIMGDMLESLSFLITLNTADPFRDAFLIVESGNEGNPNHITIKNPITGNSLDFIITDQKMQEINTKFPFTPKLSIFFEESKILGFPRELYATQLYFKAIINYSIDLARGGN
jgi:hypothetical protein